MLLLSMITSYMNLCLFLCSFVFLAPSVAREIDSNSSVEYFERPKLSGESSFYNPLRLLSCLAEWRSIGFPKSANSVIFPSESSLAECQSLNRVSEFFDKTPFAKFCLAKIKFLVPQQQSSDENDESGGVSVSVSLALGLCMPLNCEGADLEALMAMACSVPSCDFFENEKLVEICSIVQPTLCDGKDRSTFGRSVHLQCTASANQKSHSKKFNQLSHEWPTPFQMMPFAQPHASSSSSSSFSSDLISFLDQLVDSSQISASIAQVLKLMPRLWTPSPDSLVPEYFSKQQMVSILSCGSATLSNTQLALASGGYQTLGDFKQCLELANKPNNPSLLTASQSPSPSLSQSPSPSESSSSCRYCSLRFEEVVSTGLCVDGSCTANRFDELTRFVCAHTGGGLKSSSETCLDFVNLIPLDVCLLINAFGCPNSRRSHHLNFALTKSFLKFSLYRNLFNARETETADGNSSSSSSQLSGRLTESRRKLQVPSAKALSKILEKFDPTIAQQARALSRRSAQPLSPPSLFGTAIAGVSPASLLGTAIAGVSPASLLGGVSPSGPTKVAISCFARESIWSFGYFVVVSSVGLVILVFPLLGFLASKEDDGKEGGDFQMGSGVSVSGRPNGSINHMTDGDEVVSQFNPGHHHHDHRHCLLEDSHRHHHHHCVVHKIPKNVIVKFLECFDVRSNFVWFRKEVQERQRGSSAHIDGLLCVCVLWIVFANTAALMVLTGTVRNLNFGVSLITQFRGFFKPVFLTSYLAYDSMLLIAGVLAGLQLPKILSLTFRQPNKPLERVQTFFKLFSNLLFSKYCQTMAVYVFVALVYLFGVPFISPGPNTAALIDRAWGGSSSSSSRNGGCAKFGWTNLLMMNNLVPGGDDDAVSVSGSQCLEWTWVIATEFQFFVIASLLVVFNLRSKPFFKIVVFLLFAVSLVSTASQIVRANLSIHELLTSSMGSGRHLLIKGQNILRNPFVRLPAFLAGLCLGLKIQTTVVVSPSPQKSADLPNNNFRRLLPNFITTPFCLLGLLVAIVAPFCVNQDISPSAVATTFIVTRLLWLSSLGGLIASMSHDSFFKNRMAETKTTTQILRVLLSRNLAVLGGVLFPTAYLIQAPLLDAGFASASLPTSLNKVTVLFAFLSYATLTGLIACGVHLFVRVPAMRLSS